MYQLEPGAELLASPSLAYFHYNIRVSIAKHGTSKSRGLFTLMTGGIFDLFDRHFLQVEWVVHPFVRQCSVLYVDGNVDARCEQASTSAFASTLTFTSSFVLSECGSKGSNPFSGSMFVLPLAQC